ncbi:MAG: hypothetical protein O3A00_21540, partial [Planctomycetota bacterium]|nr:hypothetical protein [Planctomycetota bacterium]
VPVEATTDKLLKGSAHSSQLSPVELELVLAIRMETALLISSLVPALGVPVKFASLTAETAPDLVRSPHLEADSLEEST